MRFDLVTNTMIKTAITQKKIVVHNSGLWRPLIDVKDASMAYIQAVEAAPSLTGTFNIAYDNYTIGGLAKLVASTLIEYGIDVPIEVYQREDVRSYRVSLVRAKEALQFEASTSMVDTVRRVMDNIRKDEITDFEKPIYYNIEQMKRANSKEPFPWNLHLL